MHVGVDGCRGGWVVARWSDGGFDARVVPHFRDVLAFPAATIAVDMPIGLLDAPAPGGRACDRAARALLGPRARSVFSPPTRSDLAARAFSDMRGISIQCYHILPKIREVDALLSPADQARVFEAHPELAFAQMHGAPLPHAKRTLEGARARRRELRAQGLALPERPRGAQEHDLLDACALAWSARRIARGEALVLGDAEAGARDARGLRMEIRA